MEYHVPMPKVIQATTPVSIAVVDMIAMLTSHHVLLFLFDTGSKKTFIHCHALPELAQMWHLGESAAVTPLTRTLRTQEVVT